jgi:hypothetical protein
MVTALMGSEPAALLLQKILNLNFFNSIHQLDLSGMTDFGSEAVYRL